MQLVSDRWYEAYTRIITVISGLLLVGSGLSLIIPSLTPMGEKLGLSYITLALAAVQLLYMVAVHKLVKQRVGLLGASLVVNFLFMFNVVSLIHSTGRLHSWYHILWMTLVFFSGIFGPFATLGFCFLTLLYLLLVVTDVPGHITYDPFSLIATAGVIGLGVISYFFWRRLYVSEESSKVAQLSGQLKTNRLRSEILINSISDGIILIGNDGKIDLINPAAATMTGWPVEEATGIDAGTVINILSEDGKELGVKQNPIQQVLTEQKQVDQVLQLIGRNKKSLTISLVVSPVIMPKAKEPLGAVAVIRDISASRAEERRSADFISTASHEMRTPVAAIEGYLALALNEKVSQIDPKARSYLEKAHASTQSLGKLFQDLLTSAKAEDGRLVSHPIVVEMGTYLEQLAEGLRFAAEKKGLLVDFRIGAETNSAAMDHNMVKPLYYASVDPDRMREVITNLFDNAVKYTETGRITIGLTGNTDVVQLSIQDTGPGIPVDDIPHLFQKFYRVDNSATRTIGGTGLGLFICRKIVELYSGRIWVESQINKGSTFYINLPRLSAQKATELQQKEAANLPVLSELTGNPTSTPAIPVSATTPHGTITTNISS